MFYYANVKSNARQCWETNLFKVFSSQFNFVTERDQAGIYSCNFVSNLLSEHHHLLAFSSNSNSRSNSSNSLTPSAKSSSSNDSYLSFPRLSKGSAESSQHNSRVGLRSRSKSPLPKILPRLPESVAAYDTLIQNILEPFLRFSSEFETCHITTLNSW